MLAHQNSCAETFLLSLKRKVVKLPKYLLQGIIHKSETGFITKNILVLLEYVKQIDNVDIWNNFHFTLSYSLWSTLMKESTREKINFNIIEKKLTAAAMLGKNTYKVAAKANYWPYEGKRVIVLSSTLTEVHEKTEIYNGDIHNLLDQLTIQGVKHIYVDGGITISQFLNENLIDELTISIIPVILGSGIYLFSQVKQESWWSLVSAQNYSNGLVQLRYEIKPRDCQ